jgi:hypothetical protein
VVRRDKCDPFTHPGPGGGDRRHLVDVIAVVRAEIAGGTCGSERALDDDDQMCIDEAAGTETLGSDELAVEGRHGWQVTKRRVREILPAVVPALAGRMHFPH